MDEEAKFLKEMQGITLNHKKRRISLQWQWSLTMIAGLFISLIIFSIVIFQSFMHIMYAKEKTDLQETLTAVTEKLQNEVKPLDNDAVLRNLSIAILEKEQERTAKEQKNSLYHNTIIEKVSRKEISVNVYDPAGKKVFWSRERGQNFLASEEMADTGIRSKKIGDKNGMAGIVPVKSNKTKQIIGYVEASSKLADFYRMKQKVAFLFWAFGLLAFLICLLIGYTLTSYFLKPIQQMTNTMKEIQAEPQSHIRVPVSKRNDELTDLAILFNNMLDQMQKYIDQQKQFVEDVSHELRTPVAIIEGHLQLLNRWGKDDPEVLAESLEASLQEISRMKSLVQEMLDLSRAEQVEIDFRHEQTRVKELIHQTFSNFQMIHPDFTFTLDDDLTDEVLVQIYRNHFEQVLIILLDNAVKYSRERKEIHLSLSKSDWDVEIAIQDFGEGIEESDIDRIFNRFYRVDKARSRNKGGNGLGLSIAKQLLEGYNGKLSVESTVGSGSIFRVELPILKEVAPNDTEKS